MEPSSNRVFRNRAPRSLRETPLLVLAGVAVFVIWAIVLAGVLLRDDEPDSVASLAADQPTPTATASATPSAIALIASSTTQSAPMPPAATTSTIPPPPPATEAVVSEATLVPQPSAPAESQATAQATQISNPAPDVLLDLLPALGDLPDGFVVTNEGSLALDELAGLHPDPVMQRERLRGWGFTAATERDFEIAPGSDGTAAVVTLLAALVVEFRTPDDARAAVEASHADAQAAENADINNAEIEPLGDFARAASGTLAIDGEPLQVAYIMIQIGNRTVTLAGGSPFQDPLAEVIAVANATLSRSLP